MIGSSATSAQDIGLFGAEQKGIVGLAAVVDLDLELRVQLAEERHEVVDPLAVLADEDREDVGAVLEQALEHLAGNRLKSPGPR